MPPLKPTHRYRGTRGDRAVPVQIVWLSKAHDQAGVIFIDTPQRGVVRVAARSLFTLTECCCEWRDDGDGESGPRIAQDLSIDCPEHGPPYLEAMVAEAAGVVKSAARRARDGGEPEVDAFAELLDDVTREFAVEIVGLERDTPEFDAFVIALDARIERETGFKLT